MRVIIMCAGNGTRWGNYLGVPKHFVTVDGKMLLHRTVEQFLGHDIFIVANSNMYSVEGTTLYHPIHNHKNANADKILNSSPLWSDRERTILLFGDVYFTDEAVQKIKEFTERDWTVFGRMKGSKITGKKWGELFAFSFYPEHIQELKNASNNALSDYKDGYVSRVQGWEIYRSWAGGDIRIHREYGHFIEIDDFTDDFDFPRDYDRWCNKRGKAD